MSDQYRIEHNPSFLPLLDRLATDGAPTESIWREWRITRVAGSGNNLLYHATSGELDLAIKFTIRDERDRAGREHAALLALQQVGLAIAPTPLWLDRERYAQPVVVQSWLPGDVLAAPPEGKDEWQRLLHHYLAIHTLTPENTALPLPAAVLNFASADDGIREIRRQLASMPPSDQPAELRNLVRHVEQAALPNWPTPRLTLCRVDPNTLNFVRQDTIWTSVDWENGGWGDPAFELADLMTHPAYAMVAAERWEWLIDAYCTRRGDPAAETRIRVYYRLMLIWWVARLARMLYEIPRGRDQRLVARPDGWQEDIRTKYERYLGMARAVQARHSGI